MSLSSLQHITYALADAMLAGPPEPDGMVERMALVSGEAADRMNGLARTVAKRFGTRWDIVGSKELSTVVAGMPGFVAAWRSEPPPRVVRVLMRPPFQRPHPPWLRDVALPQLPTLGDLATGWPSSRTNCTGLPIDGECRHTARRRRFITIRIRRSRSATVDAGSSRFRNRGCGRCNAKCCWVCWTVFQLTIRRTVFDVAGIS